MTVDILLASAVLLHVVIAAILVRQYLRTRDVAFIWLGAAVVVWPLVSQLLEAGVSVSITRVLNRQAVVYPFTLIERGQLTTGTLLVSFTVFQQLTGVCLLLIAVLYLSRAKNQMPERS